MADEGREPYIAVEAESLTDLYSLIAQNREKGYRLQGGISVAMCYVPQEQGSNNAYGTWYWYAQAMVLELLGPERSAIR